MVKLLGRYGKPVIPAFIVAVLLLIVRAISELTLPSLMADIVDDGIAGGGIESAVPEALSFETYELIYAHMPAHLQRDFRELYNIQPAGGEFLTPAVRRFPAAQYEDIYIRTTGLPMIHLDFQHEIALVLGYLQTGAPVSNEAAMLHAREFISAELVRLGVDLSYHQLSFVYSAGIMMIAVTFISILAAVGQGFISARVATGIARKVREDIFGKVVGFTNAEYNNFSTASLITRSTNDVTQVQNLLAIAIRIVVYSPIMAVGGILMVLGTDLSMAWIIGVVVGLIIMFIVLFVIIATPKFKIMQQLIDKVNLVTREGLTGIMVIRAFTTQKHEAKRFDGVNTDLKKTALFLARLGALQMPVISLIMSFGTLMIVWIGASSIDAGNLAVGNMMAFIQYTMFIVWSFLMFAMIVIMLPRAQVAATRIMEILNTESVVLDPEKPVMLDKNRGDIEFRNVSFKYPGAEGYALENINFTAEAGKVTAFIGSTGSGKTSLVSLIPRFYDVTEGEVRVMGADVRRAKQEDVREQIGFVPQKAVLFSGTIESNIKYGGKDLPGTDMAAQTILSISDEDMKKAAKIAQADDFIEERENGYEDEIAQGGTNVSGGQRQRLSIARAIAKNPKIYIFDDSFSALDYKTDAALRSALAEESGGATMLIVAQRIGTIKNADRIIVLDEGKIVGDGTHKELLSKCDVYRQIAASQLSEEELGIDFDADGGVMA